MVVICKYPNEIDSNIKLCFITASENAVYMRNQIKVHRINASDEGKPVSDGCLRKTEGENV